jgi:hypothetical protein
MLEATPEDDLLAVRDRAILMGYASGRRRSELPALDVGDLFSLSTTASTCCSAAARPTKRGGGAPSASPTAATPTLALSSPSGRWLGIAELEVGPL